jgi:squalene cyclase
MNFLLYFFSIWKFSFNTYVKYVASWYAGELCQLITGHMATGVSDIFTMTFTLGVSGSMS